MSSPDGAPQGSCQDNRYRPVPPSLAACACHVWRALPETMLAIRRKDTVETADKVSGERWGGRTLGAEAYAAAQEQRQQDRNEFFHACFLSMERGDQFTCPAGRIKSKKHRQPCHNRSSIKTGIRRTELKSAREFDGGLRKQRVPVEALRRGRSRHSGCVCLPAASTQT